MSGQGQSKGSIPWILFFPIVFIVQVLVAVALPHLIERHTYEVIEREELLYVQWFGRSLTHQGRYNGDVIYDAMLVNTGTESFVYRFVMPEGQSLPGEDQFAAAWFGGSMVDELFDYILLLCYRIGLTSLFLIFAGVILCTLFAHAMVDRHRRRYVFGDTDIVHNAYARTVTLVSLPLAFTVITLPITLSPLVVVALVSLCGSALSYLVLSLPKKT